MKPLRYIAVEGPIGVGKTTLTRLLAEEFKGRIVLEEAEENPFLPSFYKDPKGFAFQTQVFFLLSRYQQQKVLMQQDLFKQATISDYIFAKDRIFAMLNLSEEEINLYDKLYRVLDAQIPKPDLVIFLQASVEALRERIKKRGIAYEKSISGEYIERLCQAYNQFFFEYDETPLLTVNCTEIDIVKNEEDYRNLLKEILNMRKAKLDKHYVSISSVRP
ncbi:MAG: deoxynucleoside kinase [Deltaproteobacteria bacterium]|nr:deoxynucleoside kinase [Deltaproteobacteria bacterium]